MVSERTAERRLPTIPKTCDLCGEGYLATGGKQRWCLACRQGARCRSQNEASRRWRLANPGRSAIRVCGECGASKQHGRSRKNEPFTCRSCKALAAQVSRPCRSCELPVSRRPSGFQTNGAYCAACLGAQSKLAEQLGLSRERVRQLIEEVLRRHWRKRDGTHMTRAEALEIVREQGNGTRD